DRDARALVGGEAERVDDLRARLELARLTIGLERIARAGIAGIGGRVAAAGVGAAGVDDGRSGIGAAAAAVVGGAAGEGGQGKSGEKRKGDAMTHPAMLTVFPSIVTHAGGA